MLFRPCKTLSLPVLFFNSIRASSSSSASSTMDSKGQRWVVPKDASDEEMARILLPASQLLQQGEAVAFPTETVYGLGANALSDEAVKKIFSAKGRPSDNPLIVHICDEAMISRVAAKMTHTATLLSQAFWPGPLTVVVPSTDLVSEFCTAGQSTVGIRMPSHPIALALIRLAGVPIAAPSANKSGKPSPTTADHVLQDLGEEIYGVVDGGPCSVGVESTVVDCTGDSTDTVTILRPGGISKEQLLRVIPNVLLDPGLEAAGTAVPKAPGMKYTHYAPRAPVRIIEGSPSFFVEVVAKLKLRGRKVGILCGQETAELLGDGSVLCVCGSHEDLESVARELYSSLRHFDGTDVDIILSESFSTNNIGQAVMNRLSKSAGHVTIRSLDDI